jgi:hypothetical protein
VIFRRKRPASTRAPDRVQVGRELFARYLRKLARSPGHSSLRPPRREKRIHEIGCRIDSDVGSDLDFSRAKNLFSFSLRRAWARAPKNLANRLSLRVKTRARAHARLGREFDAGLQKT